MSKNKSMSSEDYADKHADYVDAIMSSISGNDKLNTENKFIYNLLHGKAEDIFEQFGAHLPVKNFTHMNEARKTAAHILKEVFIELGYNKLSDYLNEYITTQNNKKSKGYKNDFTLLNLVNFTGGGKPINTKTNNNDFAKFVTNYISHNARESEPDAKHDDKPTDEEHDDKQTDAKPDAKHDDKPDAKHDDKPTDEPDVLDDSDDYENMKFFDDAPKQETSRGLSGWLHDKLYGKSEESTPSGEPTTPKPTDEHDDKPKATTEIDENPEAPVKAITTEDEIPKPDDEPNDETEPITTPSKFVTPTIDSQTIEQIENENDALELIQKQKQNLNEQDMAKILNKYNDIITAKVNNEVSKIRDMINTAEDLTERQQYIDSLNNYLNDIINDETTREVYEAAGFAQPTDATEFMPEATLNEYNAIVKSGIDVVNKLAKQLKRFARGQENFSDKFFNKTNALIESLNSGGNKYDLTTAANIHEMRNEIMKNPNIQKVFDKDRRDYLVKTNAINPETGNIEQMDVELNKLAKEMARKKNAYDMFDDMQRAVPKFSKKQLRDITMIKNIKLNNDMKKPHDKRYTDRRGIVDAYNTEMAHNVTMNIPKVNPLLLSSVGL